MELSIKVDSQTSEAELDFAIDTLKKFKKVQAEGRKETPNHNPNFGFSSGLSSAPVVLNGNVSAEVAEKLKNEPVAPVIRLVPVPETTIENGFTYSAPIAQVPAARPDRFVAEYAAPKSEFSPASAPPMFSEANLKLLAERQAMNSGVKSAPIVAPFSPPAMPTVLPQKLNPAPAFDFKNPVFLPADPNVSVPLDPSFFRR